MSGGLTSVGASQSQLVSYGGSTFLIQPAPDGTSAPLITAVTAPGAREEAGDPGLAGAMPAQGEVSPQHSLSYATRVSPATIQWLIANYETAEVSYIVSPIPPHHLTPVFSPGRLSAPLHAV